MATIISTSVKPERLLRIGRSPKTSGRRKKPANRSIELSVQASLIHLGDALENHDLAIECRRRWNGRNRKAPNGLLDFTFRCGANGNGDADNAIKVGVRRGI